jgi:hypothetical protein
VTITLQPHLTCVICAHKALAQIPVTIEAPSPSAIFPRVEVKHVCSLPCLTTFLEKLQVRKVA